MSTAEQRRAYRLANPEKCSASNTQWRSNRPASYLFCRARQRAKTAGIAFELTEQWVQDRLLLGVCEATGIALQLDYGTNSRRNPWSPSIDRKDSSIGYTFENCRIVCWVYNCAASTWGDKPVNMLAKALVERQK